MKYTKGDLLALQSLPLEAKINMTLQRIRVWYESWKRFDIKDIVTGKERFAVINTQEQSEPEMKETEYITGAQNGWMYVSFSGGKDSTVLLDLVRSEYPDVEAVFVNTGLEYLEIQKFVKSFDNVTILRPEMRFDEVIKKYGYPMISKRVSMYVDTGRRHPDSQRARWIRGDDWTKFVAGGKYTPLLTADFNISGRCCDIMKKKPAKKFAKMTGKKPMTAQMAAESISRENNWLKYGCNGFEMKEPISNPMSFWTEQDVLQYIKQNNIQICSVYGEVVYAEEPGQMRIEELGVPCGSDRLITTGCDRTGCIFCGFGCHIQKNPSRFERLKETHPRQYQYCMEGGEYDEDGIWRPNKQGLGMKHVFDELNEIYGDDFIKY